MMPYITSVERIGMRTGHEKGLAEGLLRGEQKTLKEGIADILEIKFGSAGAELLPEIQQLDDIATIRRIKDGLKMAATLDDARQLVAGASKESNTA